MLFLLNDRVVDVPVPEVHLQQRWRDIGCGQPHKMRAQDALAFVKDEMTTLQQQGRDLDAERARDFAALIIAKTGANSLILKPTPSGQLEPRLRDLPPLVLETYQRGAANDGGVRQSELLKA